MSTDSTAISFAVTAHLADGQWIVAPYEDDFRSPQDAIRAVRGLRAPGAACAVLCVDNDYFVLLRPVPGGVRMLLSDATMAVDDDYAAQWLELRDLEIPDIDPADLDDIDGFADGDFDIFADLGLGEDSLAFIVDNDEDWPADMLLRIAGELGFGDELEDYIAELVGGDNAKGY